MVQLSIRYQVNRSMLLQSTVRVCKCFFVSKHILSLKFWKYILSTPNHSTGIRTFFVIITLKAFIKSQQNKKMCQSSCFGMLCFAMNCVPVLCEKYLNCEISAYKPLLWNDNPSFGWCRHGPYFQGSEGFIVFDMHMQVTMQYWVPMTIGFVYTKYYLQVL